MINDKELVAELLELIEDYHKGMDAFRILIDCYPDKVRTTLGKDPSLQYHVDKGTTREALGNKLEIALGLKVIEEES